MENNSPQAQIALKLIGLASFVNFKLTEDLLDFYIAKLESIGWAAAERGIDELMADATPGKFPNVNQIKAAATGLSPNAETHDRMEAQAAIGKLFELLCRPTLRQKDLRAQVGELAWMVMQQNGGFNSLSDRIDNKNQSFVKRELLDAAAAIQYRQRQGLIDVPVGLPLSPARKSDLRVVSASDMADQFAHLMPKNVRPLKP